MLTLDLCTLRYFASIGHLVSQIKPTIDTKTQLTNFFGYANYFEGNSSTNVAQ